MEVFRSVESQSLAASHFHFETTALGDAVDFYTGVMNFSEIHRSADARRARHSHRSSAGAA